MAASRKVPLVPWSCRFLVLLSLPFTSHMGKGNLSSSYTVLSNLQSRQGGLWKLAVQIRVFLVNKVLSLPQNQNKALSLPAYLL